jgi:hypothetical protein
MSAAKRPNPPGPRERLPPGGTQAAGAGKGRPDPNPVSQAYS